MFTAEWKIEVGSQKLVGYLISLTHPVGRSKAKFFRGVGFDDDCVGILQSRLEVIARLGKIVERMDTPYGAKYVIDGILDTPSGNRVTIRTVWMESPNKVLRFITAYPAREEK